MHCKSNVLSHVSIAPNVGLLASDRPELRERIVTLADSGQIITIVPQDVNLEDLAYRPSEENRLVVTDGKSFRLDVNEFSGIV
jgi:hypothetical protein